MSGVLPSVVEAIGSTPLVDLARLTERVDGHIIAKLEYLNPGHSKKDRIARRMIEDAAASGALRPGQPVVELTSGNTGTGLALVCAVKGHPFVAVMSRGNSPERAQMMRAFGAEVVLVAQAAGSEPGHVSGDDLALVEAEAARLAAERGAFRADQFQLASNVLAHEEGTGAELWAQCGGRVDAFCDFVGSGGSFAGVARALKARRPGIACYVVEPTGAAALAGLPISDAAHRIQGGGYAMATLPLLDARLVKGYRQVDDERAIAVARQLARTEGIFAGYSSGAVVAAALDLLEGPCRGNTVAVLLADSGMKYLSTDLWTAGGDG